MNNNRYLIALLIALVGLNSALEANNNALAQTIAVQLNKAKKEQKSEESGLFNVKQTENDSAPSLKKEVQEVWNNIKVLWYKAPKTVRFGVSLGVSGIIALSFFLGYLKSSPHVKILTDDLVRHGLEQVSNRSPELINKALEIAKDNIDPLLEDITTKATNQALTIVNAQKEQIVKEATDQALKIVQEQGPGIILELLKNSVKLAGKNLLEAVKNMDQKMVRFNHSLFAAAKSVAKQVVKSNNDNFLFI